jgi:hypothetical protein
MVDDASAGASGVLLFEDGFRAEACAGRCVIHERIAAMS